MMEYPDRKCQRGHDLSVVGIYVRVLPDGRRKNSGCYACSLARTARARRATSQPRPLRKEGHCYRGHDLSVVGVYRSKNGGGGSCVACKREQSRQYQAKLRADAKERAKRQAAATVARRRAADPTDVALDLLVRAEPPTPHWIAERLRAQAHAMIHAAGLAAAIHDDAAE